MYHIKAYPGKVHRDIHYRDIHYVHIFSASLLHAVIATSEFIVSDWVLFLAVHGFTAMFSYAQTSNPNIQSLD